MHRQLLLKNCRKAVFICSNCKSNSLCKFGNDGSGCIRFYVQESATLSQTIVFKSSVFGGIRQIISIKYPLPKTRPKLPLKLRLVKGPRVCKGCGVPVDENEYNTIKVIFWASAPLKRLCWKCLTRKAEKTPVSVQQDLIPDLPLAGGICSSCGRSRTPEEARTIRSIFAPDKDPKQCLTCLILFAEKVEAQNTKDELVLLAAAYPLRPQIMLQDERPKGTCSGGKDE